MRHRRVPGHLAARRSARPCTSTRSPTGWRPPSSAGSRDGHPVDRAAVDGGAPSPRAPSPSAVRRLRHAGVDTASSVAIGDAQAAVAPDPGDDGRGVPVAQATSRRTSRSSRCARRRAARTSSSAGRTAPRRSWSTATAARGRAASASSTRVGRCRSTPPSPRASPRPSTRLGLSHAVITCVARDDLADGGASALAACVGAIRERTPACAVEVLTSDLKGDRHALQVLLDARPDVLNHNVETVRAAPARGAPVRGLRAQPDGARPGGGRRARRSSPG